MISVRQPHGVSSRGCCHVPISFLSGALSGSLHLSSLTTMDNISSLFQDPEGFYPPDKEPSFAYYPLLSGHSLRVRLVGSHPLYVRISM